MPFVLRAMRKEDLDRIFSKEVAAEVAKATGATRESWLKRIDSKRWAVDGDAEAYLLELPLKRDESLWRYLLGTKDGIAYFEKAGYCKYRIRYLSRALETQKEKVRDLMEEAFRVAGEFFDGASDPADESAVPHVELVSS